MCEHAFVRGKGSPHAHFQRALERGHLLSAETAARDLPKLTLADALALCLLMAEQDLERFDRAGPRWHARLVLETKHIGLVDAQLALAAVAALPDAAAANLLADLARRYRIPNVAALVRRAG